jgi:hypothetical protein
MFVEDEAHLDRVPQLTARPSPVAATATLDGEACTLVQPARRGVVRPHLEVDLVGTGAHRPLDASADQLPTEAAAAVLRHERHRELAAAAVQLDPRESDDKVTVDSHERARVFAGMLRRGSQPCRAIVAEGQLGADPASFPGDGLEHGDQAVGITGFDRPDDHVSTTIARI